MNTGHESLLAADKPSFGSQFLFHFDDIMVLAFIIVLGITVCTPLYLLRLAFRLAYVLWRIGAVGLLALVPVGKTLVGFYMFTRAAILLLTIFTIFSVPFDILPTATSHFWTGHAVHAVIDLVIALELFGFECVVNALFKTTFILVLMACLLYIGLPNKDE